VHVWTVNTEQDVRLCRDLGVDALISDHPELALKTLAEDPADAPAYAAEHRRRLMDRLRRNR
jgi:glycerophosphoryl diester phosphodiesterase